MTAAAAVSASAYIVGHRHIPLIKFMGRRIVQKTEVRTVKGPTITKPVTSTTEGTFDPGRNRFPRLPLTAEEIECVQSGGATSYTPYATILGTDAPTSSNTAKSKK